MDSNQYSQQLSGLPAALPDAQELMSLGSAGIGPSSLAYRGRESHPAVGLNTLNYPGPRHVMTAAARTRPIRNRNTQQKTGPGLPSVQDGGVRKLG